jgi:hypothetical protein
MFKQFIYPLILYVSWVAHSQVAQVLQIPVGPSYPFKLTIPTPAYPNS